VASAAGRHAQCARRVHVVNAVTEPLDRRLTTTPTPVTTWPRRVLGATLMLTLGLATLAGVVFAGIAATGRSVNQPVPTTSMDTSAASLRYAEPAGSANPQAMAPGRRLVVAFVVGTHGTVASDLLAPYDIFASSPAFTTYVAAATMAAAPLEGGPAVVPTYTFVDVDADPALTPDLVVVPGLTQPTGASEAPLRSWVTRQHDDGAKVLGVCSGSLVLAPTGMLDGLHATSHWSRISALESSRPAVHWMRGRRYVEDGSVTTTAAVTSGVPAALHLVAELAGPVEAQRVADLHPELRWTPTQTTNIPEDHFALHDWPVGLNYVMPWFRPTVGIALEDGVGELDATAAFEVYSQSTSARTIALAEGDTVRTRHGLVLLTTSLAHAPDLSRVLVPGATTLDAVDPRLRAWGDQQRLIVEPLTVLPGTDGAVGAGGFSAALQNLADHTDAATTSATAKMIGYPTPNLDLGNHHRPLRPILLGVASLALAVLIGLAPAFLARGGRRRRLRRANASAPVSVSDPEAVRVTV
jgi:putative intracellular protease/amidase